MTSEQFEIIFHTQIAFFILGALFSFFRFQKREAYIKLIGFYCLACAVADLSADILYNYLKVNPNYISSVFYIVSFPLLSGLYYLAIGKCYKRLFAVITVFYCLFALTNLLFIQKKDINSYSLILTSIIIILYCLYYFYWLIKELPTMYLHRLPMFWINSAFMVYFSGNLFLFVFTSYLINVLKVTDNILLYWSLHNFLGMIEFSMIMYALWIDLKAIKSKSS